jgi:hypothetical protein
MSLMVVCTFEMAGGYAGSGDGVLLREQAPANVNTKINAKDKIHLLYFIGTLQTQLLRGNKHILIFQTG